MSIIYTESYKKTLKKLKKHKKELANLLLIEEFVNNSSSFTLVKSNPLSMMYGFEPLKYGYNGYYSFNLCKNGGTIRLIVKPSDDMENTIFVYISFDHYKDFNPDRVIYYDE